jgi:hypothetical protein
MKKYCMLMIFAALMTSCRNEKPAPAKENIKLSEAIPEGCIPVAKDIVTEIIVKPDTLGDPWEKEKVAGYDGKAMVNNIFKSIYNGTLTVKDYHTGVTLKPSDIMDFEKDFTDRSKIGKLSFTEDWYYDPSDFSIHKRVKSIVFGYELLNNEGKVFGYKAAFAIETAK